MKPDTHLGENARQIEVSDDQTTSFLSAEFKREAAGLVLDQAIAISKPAVRSGLSSPRCVAGLTNSSKSATALLRRAQLFAQSLMSLVRVTTPTASGAESQTLNGFDYAAGSTDGYAESKRRR
jgi:hypothetical protein